MLVPLHRPADPCTPVPDSLRHVRAESRYSPVCYRNVNLMLRVVSGTAWRFLVTGGLSYLVDTGTLILLHELSNWPVLWATTGAYLVAFVFIFTLNRVWVFEATDGAMGVQTVRYLIL